MSNQTTPELVARHLSQIRYLHERTRLDKDMDEETRRWCMNQILDHNQRVGELANKLPVSPVLVILDMEMEYWLIGFSERRLLEVTVLESRHSMEAGIEPE